MSTNSRKDKRTNKQFASDIKSYTKKEAIWANILKTELTERGHKVEYIDNGIDNSGKVIKNTSNQVTNADFLFKIDKQDYLFEIKTCDQNKDFYDLSYITYKRSSLRSSLEQNSRIITVDRLWWMVMRTEVIKRIIDNFKSENYSNFASGKKAYRIYNSTMKNMTSENKEKNKFQLMRWSSDKSKSLIEKYSNTLFKKRLK